MDAPVRRPFNREKETIMIKRFTVIALTAGALVACQDSPVQVATDDVRFAAERRIPTPTLTEEALAALQAHDWPGNVRQLRNIIERTIIMAPGDRVSSIDVDLLPGEILDNQGAVGISTTRTLLHRAKDGELAAGTTAAADELIALGDALGGAGHRVFSVASDLMDLAGEMSWMAEISRRIAVSPHVDIYGVGGSAMLAEELQGLGLIPPHRWR